MKILVTGSTGFIGSSLVRFLKINGHTIHRLARQTTSASEGEIYWNPDRGQIDSARLEHFDAVIHLAGENISTGRWTASKKKEIRDSRIKGTRLLSDALASLQHPPRVFISGSAVGYYGDKGRNVIKEDASPGADFLSEVCRVWEEATAAAVEKGIRAIVLRFGIVLGRSGGAFPKMCAPFRMGAGGTIGSGRQYMSWVAIDDALHAVEFILGHPTLHGPVNLVSPSPVTNADWTQLLGRYLKRPTIFHVPAWVIKTFLGEMGTALLLSSQRAVPQKLTDSGFTFNYPTLEEALPHILFDSEK